MTAIKMAGIVTAAATLRTSITMIHLLISRARSARFWSRLILTLVDPLVRMEPVTHIPTRIYFLAGRMSRLEEMIIVRRPWIRSRPPSIPMAQSRPRFVPLTLSLITIQVVYIIPRQGLQILIVEAIQITWLSWWVGMIPLKPGFCEIAMALPGVRTAAICALSTIRITPLRVSERTLPG